MNIFFAIIIFCITLFLYLHIYYQLKTSNDLEIYEIDETTLRDNIPVPARLRRIEKIEDINKLFNIRTDQSVLEIETSFGREKNWYRTGE